MTTSDLSRAGWRTSTHRSGTGGNCVEVATSLPGVVAARDRKNQDGPGLTLASAPWRSCAAGMKPGDLDLG